MQAERWTHRINWSLFEALVSHTLIHKVKSFSCYRSNWSKSNGNLVTWAQGKRFSYSRKQTVHLRTFSSNNSKIPLVLLLTKWVTYIYSTIEGGTQQHCCFHRNRVLLFNAEFNADCTIRQEIYMLLNLTVLFKRNIFSNYTLEDLLVSG